MIRDFRDVHQETTVLGQGITSHQDIDLGSYQKPVSVEAHVFFMRTQEDRHHQAGRGAPRSSDKLRKKHGEDTMKQQLYGPAPPPPGRI